MDKQNLMPQVAQPVNRITTGQLPTELAELSEEALQLHGDDTSMSASVLALIMSKGEKKGERDWRDDYVLCSYDGDDAE